MEVLLSHVCACVLFWSCPRHREITHAVLIHDLDICRIKLSYVLLLSHLVGRFLSRLDLVDLNCPSGFLGLQMATFNMVTFPSDDLQSFFVINIAEGLNTLLTNEHFCITLL